MLYKTKLSKLRLKVEKVYQFLRINSIPKQWRNNYKKFIEIKKMENKSILSRIISKK